MKKLQTLPKALLQALKNYYNKYFSRANYPNACVNRRGYWQVLAVFAPYHLLLTNMEKQGFDFLSFISWPYFIPSLFLLLLYMVAGVVFIVIASHRCRDIGISTWYTLLVLVPSINIAFLIILGCLKTGAVKKYRKKYRKKHSLAKNKKTDL